MSSSFRDILQPIIFLREDDAPIEALASIYPFRDINEINQFDYEAVLSCVSIVGFTEIITSVLKWICNPNLSDSGYPIGAESNLMDQFSYCLNDADFMSRIVTPSLNSMSSDTISSLEKLVLPILSSGILDQKDQLVLEKFLTALKC